MATYKFDCENRFSANCNRLKNIFKYAQNNFLRNTVLFFSKFVLDKKAIKSLFREYRLAENEVI